MSIDVRSLVNHPRGQMIAGDPRAFIARAPGRVNLIGEHTDYNGLPVLPMAINREIAILAVPRSDPLVQLSNIDVGYPDREFTISDKIEPFEQGDWGNYAKAAAQALVEHQGRVLDGFQGLVAGDIPPGAGLSSSSAMVVACALALMQANKIHIPRGELADLLARGERYVGTQGGGMDQTVCLLAEEAKALRIDFFPTRSYAVPLPKEANLVVCNSLVPAEKAGKARDAYNTRVVECRIGLALLSRMLSRSGLRFLGDLLRAGIPLEKILESVESLPEVIKDPGQIDQDALKLGDGSLLPMPVGGFRIRSRCRHVFTEAARVEQAAQTSDAREFGRLMNESHASCADDYGISCPEMEALVGICRRSGAFGARLTGAGFGGCAIALVADQDTIGFVNKVTQSYYVEWLPKHRPDIPVPQDLSNVIFACRPAAGASVELLKGIGNSTRYSNAWRSNILGDEESEER